MPLVLACLSKKSFPESFPTVKKEVIVCMGKLSKHKACCNTRSVCNLPILKTAMQADIQQEIKGYIQRSGTVLIKSLDILSFIISLIIKSKMSHFLYNSLKFWWDRGRLECLPPPPMLRFFNDYY